MTASPQDIAESLYAELTSPGDLATALDGRVYYQLGPHNQEQPYLIFNLLNDPLSRTFGGYVSHEMQVHFDLFVPRSLGTSSSTSAGTIAEYLYALDGTELVVDGLDRGVLLFDDPGVPEIEEDCIRVTANARIKGTTGTAQLSFPLLYTNVASGTLRTNTSAVTVASQVITGGLLKANDLIIIDVGFNCGCGDTIDAKLCALLYYECAEGGTPLVLASIGAPLHANAMSLFMNTRIGIRIPGANGTARHQSTTRYVYGEDCGTSALPATAPVAKTGLGANLETAGSAGTTTNVTLTVKAFVTFTPVIDDAFFQLAHAQFQVIRGTGTVTSIG